MPEELGQLRALRADNGYCSAAHVLACAQAGIEPMLAIKGQTHHQPIMERFAPDQPPPQTTDPVRQMAYRLGRQAGRAL